MIAHIKEIVDNQWLIFVLRVVLGGIFITASFGKFQNQAEFVYAVMSYGILPDSLAQLYGLVLPWAELFIGCALVLGIFTRFASVLTIPLVISFITASAYALFHSLEDNCGCFGQLIALSHPVALAIDAVMLSMVVQLLLHKTGAEFLGIGPLLRRRYRLEGRRGFIFEKAGKAAIVILAMMAVVYFTGGAQGSLDTETDSTPRVDDEVAQSTLNTKIDNALDSGKPAFLFFYCAVCPSGRGNQFEMITDLEQEYGERIVFIRINYREDPQVAKKFDIETDPTALLITGKSDEGEYIVYQRFEGAIDEEMIKDSFAQVLRDEPH